MIVFVFDVSRHMHCTWSRTQCESAALGTVNRIWCVFGVFLVCSMCLIHLTVNVFSV